MSNNKQMMRLARTRQNNTDVGACGPMYNPQATVSDSALARMGISGVPANPSSNCPTIPSVPDGLIAKEGSLYTQCTSPFTISFGVDSEGNVYNFAAVGAVAANATIVEVGAELANSQTFAQSQLIGQEFATRSNTGVVSAFGFRALGLSIGTNVALSATTVGALANTLNNENQGQPGDVALTSVSAGDLMTNNVVGQVDLAFYQTSSCFCPTPSDICYSTSNALRIAARATGSSNFDDGAGSTATERVVPVYLTIWGTKLQSINACGPTAAYAGMMGR